MKVFENQVIYDEKIHKVNARYIGCSFRSDTLDLYNNNCYFENCNFNCNITRIYAGAQFIKCRFMGKVELQYWDRDILFKGSHCRRLDIMFISQCKLFPNGVEPGLEADIPEYYLGIKGLEEISVGSLDPRSFGLEKITFSIAKDATTVYRDKSHIMHHGDKRETYRFAEYIGDYIDRDKADLKFNFYGMKFKEVGRFSQTKSFVKADGNKHAPPLIFNDPITGMQFSFIPSVQGEYSCPTALVSRTMVTNKNLSDIYSHGIDHHNHNHHLANSFKEFVEELPNRPTSIQPPWRYACIIYALDDLGFRFPTYAEYLRLLRGNSHSNFYWGEFVEDANLFEIHDSRKMADVATKKPNYYGLYDMHGNCPELCWGDDQKSGDISYYDQHVGQSVGAYYNEGILVNSEYHRTLHDLRDWDTLGFRLLKEL